MHYSTKKIYYWKKFENLEIFARVFPGFGNMHKKGSDYSLPLPFTLCILLIRQTRDYFSTATAYPSDLHILVCLKNLFEFHLCGTAAVGTFNHYSFSLHMLQSFSAPSAHQQNHGWALWA
jgi:hypothetical protein